MFTICLKFQLTKKSARFMVANAMCKQSAKLVCPTTFSAMYSFAKSTASIVVSTNSVRSALRLFYKPFYLIRCIFKFILPNRRVEDYKFTGFNSVKQRCCVRLKFFVKMSSKNRSVYVNSLFHFYFDFLLSKIRFYLFFRNSVINDLK